MASDGSLARAGSEDFDQNLDQHDHTDPNRKQLATRIDHTDKMYKHGKFVLYLKEAEWRYNNQGKDLFMMIVDYLLGVK